jgi:restriction system protein
VIWKFLARRTVVCKVAYSLIGYRVMAIPKYNEMYKEILTVISDGKVYPTSQLLDLVGEIKGVTAEDRNITISSSERGLYYDRFSWARSYLKAAGLVEYPQRSETRITSEGKRVIDSNPAVIDNKFLRKYDSFRLFVHQKRKGDVATQVSVAEPEMAEDATPAERMEHAFSELNAQLEDELLAAITSKPPIFFEKTVVKLLVSMGYGGLLGEKAGRTTQASRDDGIDGIIQEDKLGFSNIFIQAKRLDPNSKVGRPAIQAFVGAIANKRGRGLFITTGSFTDDAKKSAKANHIVLIDGNRLASLMIEHGVGVSTIQTYAIKKVDSDYFIE